MKSPFMIKKAYVQTARLKHAKFVRGVENVTLVIVNLQRRIIDSNNFGCCCQIDIERKGL
ncbi:MAG: hypothetical protein ACM3ZS_08325 [Nitrososphaerota archaeon]